MALHRKEESEGIMVIQKKDVRKFIPIFLLILYAFTIGMTKHIYMFSTVTIPASFIIALFFFKVYFTRNIVLKKRDILVVILLLIMLLDRNANLAAHDYNAIYFSFTFFVFYILSNNTDEWHTIALKLLSLMGIFYALMTFITMVVPSVFYGVTNALYSDSSSYSSLIQSYSNGYMPGITNNVGVNAIFLTVGLFAIIARLFSSENKKVKLFIMALFVVIALFATGKRAHTAFGMIAILVAYYFYNCDKPTKGFFKLIFIVAILAGAFIIAADYLPFLSNAINRWSIEASKGDIGNGRTYLRGIALSEFSQHKWIGIGWDRFKYLFLSSEGSLYNVHCVYIQILCEVGIIGAIPFFLFFLRSLRNTIWSIKYVVKNKKSNDINIAPLVFSILMNVFFLLYCITGNPLYDAPSLLAYIFACSIGDYYYNRFLRYRYELSDFYFL